MNIKRFQDMKEEINNSLEYFLTSKRQDVEGESREIVDFYEVLKNYNLRGGKRIRGCLFMLLYENLEEEKVKNYVNAALAIELLQASLLIHDDIMDKTDTRRGGPTFHKRMEEINEDRDRHYNQSLAIMAGSLCYKFGIDLVQGLDCDESVQSAMVSVYNSVYEKTAQGQIRDLSNRVGITEEDYFKTILDKTTYYTAFLPVEFAGILSETPREEIEELKLLFKDLFSAFQIWDDIIDCFPIDPDKDFGTDIKEGKPTLLLQKAISKADEVQMKILTSVLGNRNATRESILEVTKILEETGSLEYCTKVTKTLKNSAIALINESLILTEETKEHIYRLSDYLVNRDF